MDWAQGSEIIRTMSASDLCAYLVIGDVMNGMLEDLARDQIENKKHHMGQYQDLGGRQWRRVAWGQLAILLGKGIAQTKVIAHVSATFPDISRDPLQCTLDQPWTFLRYCVHREDPHKALAWGLAHDYSLFDIAHMREDGDGYVVEAKKIGLEHGGMVTCPLCQALFKVVRTKRNEVVRIEEQGLGEDAGSG